MSHDVDIQRIESNLFRLTTRQWLPLPPEDVFPFFADAANLQRITPPWLHFRIATPQPIDMAVGSRIDYRLKLHRIPIRWKTRITAWEPPYRFQDTQIKGPYRQWTHTHTFEPIDRGTLARDVVDYAVPGGWLVNKLFVQRDVTRIFAHRAAVLQAHFDNLHQQRSGRSQRSDSPMVG